MKKWKKILFAISAVILIPTICIIGIAVAAAATGNRFTQAGTEKAAKPESKNEQPAETASADLIDASAEVPPVTDAAAASEQSLTDAQTAQTNTPDNGNNAFYLITPAGTSENGNTPVLSITADTQESQIDFSAQGMSAGNLIFIFIDDSLIETRDSSMTQGTLTLTYDALTEGTHTVKAIQYEDDTVGGTTIMQALNSYKIVIGQ